MIRCIAIDDEPLALKQIEAYISKTPFLDLAGSFESPFEAMDVINNGEVDLIFLDINMPDLNGMDFIKSLSNPPKVIFTTAYSEYAIDGFKVNAVDYLLKPISYPDFLKSAEKYKSTVEPNTQISSNKDYLFIKSEYKIVRVNFNDIKYIESMREYVGIYTDSVDPIMTLMSMKKMEHHLINSNFMRVHRSYIVNLDKITTIEKNQIVFDNRVYITISEQYKTQFYKYLDKHFFN